MSIRKVFPILIFLAGAILGKPLALCSLGLFVKAYLYFENGWRFSYNDIDYYEGKLIFSRVNLEDSVAASLKAERISVFWSAHHLEIERPVIEMRGMPRLKQGASDWTLEANEGTLVGERFGEFRFSFERTWRHHLGRLILQQGGSRLALEGMREEDEIWVDADLYRFDAEILKHWVDWKGIVDGRMHLIFKENECKRGSAHLNFQRVSYGKIITEGKGSLDWEGEVERAFFEKSLQSGRIRLQLIQANVLGSRGGVERVKGNFSLTAGVGAKWEFEGTASSKNQRFPIGWNGRAFLHGSRPHWAESEVVCLDARIAVQGTEEIDGFRWKGEGRGINAAIGTLIQSLGSLVDRRFEGIDFDQGTIDVDGETLYGKEWNVSLRGENLLCRRETSFARCHEVELRLTSQENGAFQFSGAQVKAAFANGKSIDGEGWQGGGEIQNGVLAKGWFAGIIEGNQAEVEASGTLGAFHLKVLGQKGDISLKGAYDNGFACEIEQGNYLGLSFEGAGWVGLDGTFSLHLNRFEGAMTPLIAALGVERRFEAQIQSVGTGFQVEGNFASYNWFLQAKGQLSDGISFYCPFIEKRESEFLFDLRIETPTWDLVRLYGTVGDGACTFDPSKTHLLGMPLQIDACHYDFAGLISMKLKVPVLWKSLIAAAPIWFKEVGQWISLPLDGQASIDFSYARNGGSDLSIEGADLSWRGKPVFFKMSAVEENGQWHIPFCQIDQCTVSTRIQKEGASLHFDEGKATWENGMKADFFGQLDSSFQFELHLPYLRLDLSRIQTIAAFAGIPIDKLEGILEGKGIVSRHSFLEADFDFVPFNLKAIALDWQNKGPIHLHYASEAGILCSGLDLEISKPNLLFFSCKIGLLQFEAARSFWILNHSQFHLTSHFLDLFPNRPKFLGHFDSEQEIDFTAELACPSDFSSLSCNIKEISLLFNGLRRHLQDVSFSFDKANALVRFLLNHHDYPIKVFAKTEIEEELSGRLVLEDGNRVLELDERPLSIDWTSSKNGFLIREIEGKFGGVEASFHALDSGTSLIGSARIDFGQLGKILPTHIAQFFSDLKMGDGYELKGKLSIENGSSSREEKSLSQSQILRPGFSFKGLFSGKQIDLFGFQLRTLLSQFELDPEGVRLYDLKVSDSAGMLKIDELVVSASENAPWTISIPHLTILELRPSLLQKKGKELESAGPLVIRELKIDNFKGDLENSKTYTAKGELSFINSFRREHTVFDIPSDLLGRIVGLDLELLIPACGVIQYELKNGFFYLTSLFHSFSEAKRSEFFLVPDPPPIMDLDGNLHILVSMKQFVLFKLTESFQILIDGKLDDPQFHLQRKRRFLGL